MPRQTEEGFQNFNIPKTNGVIKLILCMQFHIKLQIDQIILDGHGQVCPGIPKEAFETYISQKLLEFQS